MTLTERQQLALRLLSEGKSRKEIARSMGISPNTVKDHLHIMRLKLGAQTSAQLTLKAARAGLL